MIFLQNWAVRGVGGAGLGQVLLDLCAGTTRVSLSRPGRVNAAVSRAALKLLFFFSADLYCSCVSASVVPQRVTEREWQGRERQGGRQEQPRLEGKQHLYLPSQGLAKLSRG